MAARRADTSGSSASGAQARSAASRLCATNAARVTSARGSPGAKQRRGGTRLPLALLRIARVVARSRERKAARETCDGCCTSRHAGPVAARWRPPGGASARARGARRAHSLPARRVRSAGRRLRLRAGAATHVRGGCRGCKCAEGRHRSRCTAPRGGERLLGSLAPPCGCTGASALATCAVSGTRASCSGSPAAARASRCSLRGRRRHGAEVQVRVHPRRQARALALGSAPFGHRVALRCR